MQPLKEQNIKMKNLKIYSMGVLLIAGAGIISSCSNEELENQGQGYIQLSSVSLDKNLTTRAEDGKTISVDIKDASGNSFVHADDWTELQGKSYLVEAGNKYTVEAYSQTGNAEAQGFNAQPYYAGSAEVTVKANTAQTVDVVCSLAQAMVSVSYTEKFLEHIDVVSSRIAGTDISFTKEETRAAYVKAGQFLELSIALTAKGASKEWSSVKTICENTLPAYHYKVVLDVDATGNGNIKVEVDNTIHEYEVTLGVPLKADGLTTVGIAGDYNLVWGQKATLAGISTLQEGGDVTFNYRKQGDSEWQNTVATKVGETNEYNATVKGLSFGTTYEYQIKHGEMTGDIQQFTTEKFVEIPNLNFDAWSGDSKCWYPNANKGSYDENGVYWATGNDGVTSFLAGSNPPITTRTEGRNGYAAEMHTMTGVTLVGAAAGNLFIGRYKTNMSNPYSSAQFGRAYDGARPTKLSGWFKYAPQPIDYKPNGYLPSDRVLSEDEGHIYVEVWDANGNTIGYGERVIQGTFSDWTEFSFDVNYTNTSVPAAKIMILCTSSHYGGEFVGSVVKGQVGTNSSLCVDDFTVSYD